MPERQLLIGPRRVAREGLALLRSKRLWLREMGGGGGNVRANCTRVTIGQAPLGVTGAGGGCCDGRETRDAGLLLEGAERTGGKGSKKAARHAAGHRALRRAERNPASSVTSLGQPDTLVLLRCLIILEVI